MKTCKPLIIVFYLFTISNSLLANQKQAKLVDTTLIFNKIRENERQFKLQKQRQLKRIETKDSLIVYGVDKQHTHITSVLAIKRNEKENRVFWYTDQGVFKISIHTWSQKINGKRHKGSDDFYFFDKGELFYKEERSIARDIPSLLLEADKYFSKGTEILHVK